MDRSRRLRPALAGAGAVAAALAVAWWATTVPTSPQPPAAVPGAAAVIEGRVVLADANARVPADATVVVFAYALDGPQVPLAVLRRPARALPLEFRLDDSLAPSAAHRVSQVSQLVIGARLGPGAEPLAQVGDWIAGSKTVAPGAKGVQLTLQPPPK
jgi:cytochrome c-type biogenesis protein CcmH